MIYCYFTDIESVIAQQLKAAAKSIYVAVAWLTNPRLIAVLSEKVKAGVEVVVVVNDDKRNLGVSYTPITGYGGKVRLITKEEGLMHHKFCIIDNSILLMGSFNWTLQSSRNHEDLLVIKDEPYVIGFFLHSFYLLLPENEKITIPSEFDTIDSIEQCLYEGGQRIIKNYDDGSVEELYYDRDGNESGKIVFKTYDDGHMEKIYTKILRKGDFMESFYDKDGDKRGEVHTRIFNEGLGNGEVQETFYDKDGKERFEIRTIPYDDGHVDKHYFIIDGYGHDVELYHDKDGEEINEIVKKHLYDRNKGLFYGEWDKISEEISSRITNEEVIGGEIVSSRLNNGDDGYPTLENDPIAEPPF